MTTKHNDVSDYPERGDAHEPSLRGTSPGTSNPVITAGNGGQSLVEIVKLKYQVKGIDFYENLKDAGQANGTRKPDTAFLLSIALRPLRLNIPNGTMKTSFQCEIPSTLSTGAGDEIPGFPQWPEQLESELRFPVITIERKRMSEDGDNEPGLPSVCRTGMGTPTRYPRPSPIPGHDGQPAGGCFRGRKRSQ